MKATQDTLKDLFKITHPSGTKEELSALYQRLITEEFAEFIVEKDEINKAKELCDLIWVCIQYANANNWDLNQGMGLLVQEYTSKFYDENHKFAPLYREDGKLLKNKGFKKIDKMVFGRDCCHLDL